MSSAPTYRDLGALGFTLLLSSDGRGCGEWFDDVLCGADAPGFPRRCPMCQPRRKNKNRKPRVGAGIACAMVGKGGERNER